jgi:phage gpG-like protein
MSYKTTVSKVWNGADVKIKGRRVVRSTAYETGLVVEGQAKLLAAVNYGYLAASITTQATDAGTEPESPKKYKGRDHPVVGKDPGTPLEMKIAKPDNPMEVLVGTPVEYAPHVEFGTVHTRARPFLRPALDLAQGKVLTIGEYKGRLEFKDYL